jgi:hypothetical protein
MEWRFNYVEVDDEGEESKMEDEVSIEIGGEL